jgi:threonine dehydratase
MLNISPTTIFVPLTTPRAKLDKLREFPVTVRTVGQTYDDSHHAAEEFQRETGATFIHPYDDPRTVAGQGTIGLEILEDLPTVDALLVPVGGGGMISGIAIAVKATSPQSKIIAVQPAASPALRDRCATVDATRCGARLPSAMGWQADWQDLLRGCAKAGG